MKRITTSVNAINKYSSYRVADSWDRLEQYEDLGFSPKTLRKIIKFVEEKTDKQIRRDLED